MIPHANKLAALALALGATPVGATPVGATAAVAPTPSPPTVSPGQPGATTGQPATPGEPGAKPTTPEPTEPTKITALPHSRISDATARLHVRLSGTTAPGSPTPMLQPSVAGRWAVEGKYLTFTPSSTLEPCSTYTLTVWAKTAATGMAPLGKRRTLTLHVACPSTVALQQSLARLGYLPYKLHSRYNLNTGPGPEPRSVAARYLYHPPAGPLRADLPHAPGLAYGQIDPTTKGAVMVYQSVHGMTPSGVPDATTWASLLAAGTLGKDDPRPYTFVTVSESIPETLEVHRGHHVALSSPANTGVPGATTEQGTFPIYARYTATTMTGTNPDGTHYSDPGVPWVNYFNGGDAVHGFPRPSYGSPQSNGCVELPIETAARVYPLLSIGDLVIVG